MGNELLHHIKPYYEIQTGHIDARRLMVNVLDEANITNVPLKRENIRFILYYVAREWAIHFGHYPFDEVMELWQQGPVLRTIHSLYERKDGGGYLDVTEIVTRAEAYPHIKQGERIKTRPMAYALSLQEYEIVRRIIRQYGHLQKQEHIDLFMRDLYQLYHVTANDFEQYGVNHFFQNTLELYDEKGRYGLDEQFFMSLSHGTSITERKALATHLKHYGQIKAKLKQSDHVCYGFYYLDLQTSTYYVIDRERRFIEIDPFSICHATPFKPANEPSRFVYVQDVLQKGNETGIVRIIKGQYIVMVDGRKEPLQSWLQRAYIVGEYPNKS